MILQKPVQFPFNADLLIRVKKAENWKMVLTKLFVIFSILKWHNFSHIWVPAPYFTELEDRHPGADSISSKEVFYTLWSSNIPHPNSLATLPFPVFPFLRVEPALVSGVVRLHLDRLLVDEGGTVTFDADIVLDHLNDWIG